MLFSLKNGTMNPPEAYNSAAAFATTQYYMNGQPAARFPWPQLEPASYDGDVARLARFNYPCRLCTPLSMDEVAASSRAQQSTGCRCCCASIYDITNPANRKGGELFNSLADVNHYDDGWTGNAWWGSAQRCAGNCGWQQGLRSCQRPPLATQPPFDPTTDYEWMAPFQRTPGAFGPSFTSGPAPGQPAATAPTTSGVPGAVEPKQKSPSYLAYYSKKEPKSVGDAKPIVEALKAAIRSLVVEVKSKAVGKASEAINQLIQRIEQSGNVAAAATLRVLIHRIVAAAAAAGAKNYAQLRSQLNEQATTTENTLASTPEAKASWQSFVRDVVAQIESK